MTLHVGIDTGGTFTDLVVLDDVTGELTVGKRPSTPAAPAQAIFHAFEAAGIDPADATSATVGTTVGTNALLERKGGRVVFVTTAGFEDVPVIGRIDKDDPYDLRRGKPRPLVARRDCVGVVERLAADGSVVTALTDEELERVARRVAEVLAGDRDDAAIAISLLFAFVDPAHERRLAALLEQRFPDIPISTSHVAAPVWREYERGSSTIIDAYLTPVVCRLADDLEAGLAERRTRPGLDHEVERRTNARRHGRSTGGSDRPLGAVRRDRRRSSLCARRGPAERDHVRHRRDERRSRPRAGRRNPTCARLRARIRAPGGSARDRSCHARRRRRLVRLDDDEGLLHVGPQSAGAAPGPRATASAVRGDGYRREPRARAPRSRQLPRWSVRLDESRPTRPSPGSGVASASTPSPRQRR